MNYKAGFWIALSLVVIGIFAAVLAVNKLGGWRYTAHRLHTLEAWPMYTQRLSQLEMLPIDSASTLFLGDSHVAFGQWQELLPMYKIYNRGIPGEGIEGLSAFAKTLPLSTTKLIIIQIGTNDLLFHKPEYVLEKLQKSLNEVFLSNYVNVLLCTIPGVNNEVRWTGIEPQNIVDLNEGIRSFPVTDRLKIYDLATKLGSQSGVLPAALTHDGVHLTGPGYKLWAEGLQDVLVTQSIPEIE